MGTEYMRNQTLMNNEKEHTKDVQAEQILEIVANALGSRYSAIYYVSLETGRYSCFQRKENSIIETVGYEGLYEDGRQKYIADYVEPEYKEIMRNFTDLTSVSAKLQCENSISENYRRKGLGWLKGRFIAAKRDENGRVLSVIYTAYDINAQRESEQQTQRAFFEAEHDSLTGVYNRKGFEKIIASADIKENPIGFALIDLDNFKMLNDRYGHDTGDRALCYVTELLQTVFRSEDIIFRMGGDEFAVLLKKCTEEAWSIICQKIKRIHESLKEEFSDKIQFNFTLSVGLCFSPKGYEDVLYQLADEALYKTKYNGRAGCCLINHSHEVAKQWHDDSLPSHAQTTTSDKELMLFALSDIYFCSYYFDLRNNTYTTIKTAPGEGRLDLSEKTSTRIVSEFVRVLVAPDDKERVAEFVNIDTLPDRLLKERYIDCEYKSLALKRWCRARYIAIKYDDKGRLTHVLFVIAALDTNKTLELDVNEYNKKSLGALFDNVPGGVVMYEWDGKRMKTLHISRYYARQYGYTLTSEQADNGFDFALVHPDDLPPFKEAVLHALNETHSLVYMYRLWNKAQKRYKWVKVDAVAEPQPEGTSLIYALFTDVTEQKEAQLELEKNRASLTAALTASDQLSFEYDPMLHTLVSFTEYNYLGLPRTIENFPQCLLEMDILHSEDMEKFFAAVHRMDNGAPRAQCDVRLKRKGEYGWYSCMFDSYFDPEKNRNVALLSVIDISLRVSTIQNYEERMRTMISMKDNIMSACTINVSRNTFRMVNAVSDIAHLIKDNLDFEKVMLGAADDIIGQANQTRYRELFSRSNLLRQAAEGNMHVEFEYLLKLSEKHYEWVMAVVEMVINPITSEVEGVAYSVSTQAQHMMNSLLEKTLKQDYIFAGTIIKDTDEFYLYDSNTGEFSDRIENFWDVALPVTRPQCSKEVYEQLKTLFVKENMIRELEEKHEVTFAYDSIFRGQPSRLEMTFSFLDDEHSMILASLRNITDIDLLHKLRYDSEHDPLTDLYNRKKFIAECTELLKKHPQDQFAMVHIDLNHFHRYNTFFGDAEGDRLLCQIATILRVADHDYDYWVYGRIEADVFCIFFPFDKERFETHLRYAALILKDFREDFRLEPKYGIYFVTDEKMPIESMMARATMAAKTVQTGIPNRTVVYNDAMEQQLREEQQIVNEMQDAIDQKQFKVYLQPKYDLSSGQAVGSEALVRWIHPEKGMISPAKFISLFEKNGFILNLDRYMWENVCMLLHKWKEEGKKLIPISVNVSRISILSETTVPFLKELIKKYDIDTRYLELELTETAYIENPEEIRQRLENLQEFGFKILMDDFGSGYSSLNTLKELPVDILKLDMKFLSESQTGQARGTTILSSIIGMSKLLKLPVIAEGVELKKQADYLRSVGCEFVQGYLFARPMPVDEYEDKILNH